MKTQGTPTVTVPDSSRSEGLFFFPNHPKVLLTPPEKRRHSSCGRRFPRIIFSFHVSDLNTWPKHNSRGFVFFFWQNKWREASSAKGSIAFRHFPNKPRPENFKPSQSCVSTDGSFSQTEGAWTTAKHWNECELASTHDTQCYDE